MASTIAYRARDPLLQPYTLKHLVLKNRLMSTAHEPNYAEDGLPKERYRLYHAQKAKGGIGLTMTARSAVVSRDSPPAFGNLHAWSDDIVPWLARLADACHEHGAAVMIQLTHLGRRTNWNKADWLPVLAPSPVREPAHRAVPKEIEDWDIARIVRDYAAAAARMQAAGLDGIEPVRCSGAGDPGFCWGDGGDSIRTTHVPGRDIWAKSPRLLYRSFLAKAGTQWAIGWISGSPLSRGRAMSLT